MKIIDLPFFESWLNIWDCSDSEEMVVPMLELRQYAKVVLEETSDPVFPNCYFKGKKLIGEGKDFYE